MIEELITFETAKLAKEKGLIEGIPVNNTYTIGFKSIKPKNKLNDFLPRNSVKGQPHLALAPTQTLLQRWLREKHEIFVTVVPYVKEAKLMWTTYLHLRDKDFQAWSTYEQALEQGLFESLKLIEL